MSEEIKNEAIKLAVELIEKETVYFKGRNRVVARRNYRKLLRACGKNCKFDKPIYIDRI